jgi:hypothetical protein
MTSVEKKILACSTELNPDLRQQQRMRHLMSHDMDVDHLIDIATKEGLAGLLYKNLMKSGVLENLDHKQRKGLQSIYYQAVRFNLQLIHELKEVLHLVNQKKIQVVLLQGIALVQQIYDDIGLRPMTDIDLWVLEEGPAAFWHDQDIFEGKSGALNVPCGQIFTGCCPNPDLRPSSR